MPNARILMSMGLAVVLVGCASQPTIDDVSEGREVLVRTESGRLVAGRLVKATDTDVVLERRDGGRTSMDRHAVAAVALPDETRDDTGVIRTTLSNATVAYREVTVPAGTVLHATLDDPLASDTSRLADRVEATLSEAISIDGHEVVAAGSTLAGTVTGARQSGKVKGRARLTFRFEELSPASDGSERLQIETRPIVVEASGSESKDAKTIGIPAAAGAVLGGILGGGKGAAAGAAIGGGAGTAVVLTTRGNEVRLAAGTPVELRLERPLTFQVGVQ